MKKSNAGFRKEYSAFTGFSKDFILQDFNRNTDANKLFYSFIEKAIKSGGNSKQKLLEIGSGTGRNACYLANKHPKSEVYALDILKESVVSGKRIAKILKCKANLKFMQGDATKLQYPKNYFDIIYSQGTLEHFKDVSVIFKEQVRVLKPEGTLIINVPQTYSYYTIKKHLGMMLNRWEPGWETQYSYGDLKRLGRKFGLKLTAIGGQEYDSKLIELVKAYGFLSKTLIPKKADDFLKAGWKKFKDKYGHLFLLEIIAVYEPLRTYVRSFGEWNSNHYSCRIHPRSYLRGFLRHTRHKKPDGRTVRPLP
ncbi:MAG: class I SAM-dependent methyltransferase [Candidatus Firestonebacteria bacterium]